MLNVPTLLAQAEESAAAVAVSADRWGDLMFGFEPGQRFAFIIVMASLATGIILGMTGMFTGMTATIHRQKAEADLKREMLDRGMTAEEVARVIESAPPDNFLDRWASKK
ncbi:MAG: hypothetical protein AAGJ46_19840 [Planctomycetota bacterium]